METLRIIAIVVYTNIMILIIVFLAIEHIELTFDRYHYIYKILRNMGW